MFCTKCNIKYNNGELFCSNCGNKLIKNKHNKKKILVFLVFLVVIICVGIVIFNKLNKFEDPFDDVSSIMNNENALKVDTTEQKTYLINLLDNEYKNGKISADEYILQYAYSIYDYNSLKTEYKEYDNTFASPNDLMEKVEENMNKLSDDTILYVVKQMTLNDVKWDVEKEANTQSSILTEKAITNPAFTDNNYKDYNVSKLSNVILSSNKHFLIYYTTDSESNNKISNNDAKKIADNLESYVTAYKNKHNLEWDYYSDYFGLGIDPSKNSKSYGSASRLLEKNDIDTKYLEEAMPVYIVNNHDSGILGYYLSNSSVLIKLVGIYMGITGDADESQLGTLFTTYSAPYFVISSNLDDFDDTQIVAAHELFHHYQKLICKTEKDDQCKSGQFTKETIANLAAINVVNVNKTGTALSRHAKGYMLETDKSIDNLGVDIGMEGYFSYIWAYNYSNIVNDGMNKLFESLKNENTLKYLYDNSNGKYKEVLTTLSEKNLTASYKNNLLIPYDSEGMRYPVNKLQLSDSDKKYSDTSNYSSINYYYVKPDNFSYDSQIVFQNSDSSLTLQLFVKENGKYKKVYQHVLDDDFIINIHEFAYYDEIVFSIINANLSGVQNLSIETNTTKENKATVSLKELGLKSLEDELKKISMIDCYRYDQTDEYPTIVQLKIGYKNKKINEMYYKGTILIPDYEENKLVYETTKKIVSTILYAFEQGYKEKFKYVSTIIDDKDDQYSVTFKIKKDYMDALNDGLNVQANDKETLINSLREEGYTCSYK